MVLSFHRGSRIPKTLISMIVNYTRMFFSLPPCHAHVKDTDINRDPTDLELSEAQREIFAGWRRPHETFRRPPESPDQEIDHGGFSMLATNEIDLVQDITSDCSVVASLCAGTARAFKGHGKVISFPRALCSYHANKLFLEASCRYDLSL
jgi:hypothetical protein